MEHEIESGEIPAGNHYHPMSSSELRDTAIALVSGMAFGSWQVHESDMGCMPIIFLPLALSDSLQLKEWERDEVIHFIGHMSDAVQRSINGYPCFMTMRAVNRADLLRLQKFISSIQALEEEVEDGETSDA